MGEPIRGVSTRISTFGLSAICAVTLAACGGNASGPTQGPPPTLACPAPVQALSHNGTAPTVTYDTPVGQGGEAPVTTACTPASGGTFELGTTTVTCTATDAGGQSASCSFGVHVSAVPRIVGTRFVAFGDSMTAGTISPAPTMLMIDEPGSYPSQLLPMLSARYSDQTITMVNEGYPGRFARDDLGRFGTVLSQDHPDIVLLMHGANDLLNLQQAGISDALQAIDSMVRQATGQGIHVLLATLPPQNPAGSRGRGAVALPDFNAGIAHTAELDSVPLVDLYGQMGTYQGYIGVDGLHPTEVGYAKIAELFMNAVKSNLEVPPDAPPDAPPSRTSPQSTRREPRTSAISHAR
jgi:lysophospholipase L1-like esterase